ncbi:hypothetical protein [Streptomyces sp. NPDC000410]|uniref:hypothetical protein n=1 Tax=Streptomyces sp. NPDC000410 TaxID=3154254 RepID=UPI00331B6E68
MSASAQETGRRVEEVLDRLTATSDPAAAAAAEELVRVLMDFYGAGLHRIVTLLDTPKAGGQLSALLGDELVASLLVLHDLHPEDTPARISRALREHPVEVVAYDGATGALRLRASAGGGCGCGSGPDAGRQAVEDALACFAPEVNTVELEQPAKEPPLLQIGTGRAAAPGRPAPATAS